MIFYDYPLNEQVRVFLRLAALFRRGTGGQDLTVNQIKVGDIVISPESHSAEIKGRLLKLTNLEFELLLAFVRQQNRVLTRGIILETVWKTSSEIGTRTVDKHVESLRKELGNFGKKIETVVGIGYVFRNG